MDIIGAMHNKYSGTYMEFINAILKHGFYAYIHLFSVLLILVSLGLYFINLGFALIHEYAAIPLVFVISYISCIAGLGYGMFLRMDYSSKEKSLNHQVILKNKLKLYRLKMRDLPLYINAENEQLRSYVLEKLKGR